MGCNHFRAFPFSLPYLPPGPPAGRGPQKNPQYSLQHSLMAGLPDLDQDAIEWLTTRVLEAVVEAEHVEPMALLYLLRRYAATDRGDLRDALGHALASALARAAADPPDDRARWLTLFTETTAISDDERLLAAAGALVSSLREEWTAAREVDRAASSIEACLQAAQVLPPHELVPAAIDELERVVGATCRPGQGRP